MWLNTIPLPPELVDEMLTYCSFRELWALAQTSRDSYTACFRRLAIKHRFPLTLPHAVTSGLLEQHKVNGIYDRISAVTVDISKDAWSKHEDAIQKDYLTPLADLFLSRHLRGQKTLLQIYTYGENDCEILGLLEIVRLAFTMAPDTIDGFAIRLSVAEEDEKDLRTRTRSLTHILRRSVFNGRRRLLSITLLSVETCALHARAVSDILLEMAGGLVAETIYSEIPLETLRLAIRWKDEDVGFVDRPDMVRFPNIVPSTLKKLHYEDKHWAGLAADASIETFQAIWPNLEEIRIDLGLERLIYYVTKDVWHSNTGEYFSTYTTPYNEFISSRPEGKGLGLRFCTSGGGGCDLVALSTVFSCVVPETCNRFSSFAFCLTVDDENQDDLENSLVPMERMFVAERERQMSQNIVQLPVESLDLRIRALSATWVTQFFLDLGISLAFIGHQSFLQDVKVVVDWKDIENDPVRRSWEYMEFDRMQASDLKRLYLEDKRCPPVTVYLNAFSFLFPNLEELYIDGGLAQKMKDYTRLKAFPCLRKISMPFPYGDPRVAPQRDDILGPFGFDVPCCMREEFWELVQELLCGEENEEENVEEENYEEEFYQEEDENDDGDNDEDSEQEDEDLEDEAPASWSSVSASSMKNLGDKPTHPADLAAITSLLLAPGPEPGTNTLREGPHKLAWMYLLPWLQELVGSQALSDELQLAYELDWNQPGSRCCES
ncbi:hypothetical protein Dda_6424 [Drechslerella dactyloides]|uniref:F-box domain-containing protein n=1 Tax=Drechslerella dactyloides TaxID=74499 RepID=A0AAD6NHE4_DREDA|nr:hypothetical protein Dda_6424 [Drechslerella dactyloides]